MQRIFLRGSRALRLEWRRFVGDEAGAVLIFLVVLPVLAGMVALGMETGKLYTVQRMMQSAADSAALAASNDLVNSRPIATAQTDALYEAQRNGFVNGSNGVAVSAAAPTSGTYAGQSTAIQVTITKQQSFSFGSALSQWLGQSAMPGFTMKATSTAAKAPYTVPTTTTQSNTTTTSTSSADACLVALSPNSEQAISFSSFSSFQSDCGVMSNATATAQSSSGASIYIGSFSSASFKYVWSRGSYYASGYSSLSPTPTSSASKVNQTTTITDPYASLTIPSLTTCDHTNYNPAWANPTIVSPGVYCGGLQVSSGGTIQFQPGTYYVANGDLYLTSSSNISCPTCTNGAGVTFVLTQTTGNNSNIGGVKITSDSSVSLSAPNSGPYAGILFYQDRNAPVGTMSSTSRIFTVSSISSATLNGAIYFPNNKISLSSYSNGTSSSTGCTVWVGRYLNLTSFSSTYVAGCKNGYNLNPPGIITTTSTTTTSTVASTGTVYRARVMQ